MTSGNIFEDYMEAHDQIQRNFLIIAVFMPAWASKAPYHRMRVNQYWLVARNNFRRNSNQNTEIYGIKYIFENFHFGHSSMCEKRMLMLSFSAISFHPWQSEPLQWHHNQRDGVSNHQRHECLLNRLFRLRSKKTSKLRVTGLCCGEFTGDRWIPRTNGQ